MKLISKLVIVVSVTSLIFVAATVTAKGGPGGGKSNTLDATEASHLTFMREEEKLARDVYMVLYEKWGSRVFNNISQSEQRHMDAIKFLIEKYELTDPVQTDTPGSFVNEELQNLYNTLITRLFTAFITTFNNCIAIFLRRRIQEHVGN